ncbi:MAG TPA: arylsulfatase [bacterium]|nr:arylsulfatase [bacterium]HOL50280.1 arylsulfatase [bacterium]HPO51719.1 arylsulfatase [bacterium]
MKKPNIIFILADDMGYGDFSFFNQGLSDTPVLESIYQEGVCLTQHYSASPVCSPARAALLTGRYPHRTGCIDTLQMNGLDRLAPDEITIADILKANGYATGLIGKWHLGAIEKKYHPNQRGFSEFVGFRGGWQDYYQWNLYYNEQLVRADGRYLTDVFTDEALRFIKRHKNDPFFLHITYNAPHLPLQSPEEDVRFFLEKGLSEGVAYIYAMIRRMDRGIGQILEELRKSGLENQTIIFFTSDNGPQFKGGGKCLMRYNHNFRGCKGNVYEGGIRVPMLVRWPGVINRGEVIDQMVHFVDWFPTILDICGLKMPRGSKNIDGKSILSILQGNKPVNSKRFWQWNRLYPVCNSNIAMRDGDWKLVKPPIPSTMKVPIELVEIDREYAYHPEQFNDIIKMSFPAFDIGENTPQLFNLQTDPLEQVDLASRYPEKVKEMEQEMNEWFEEVESERKLRIQDK